MLFDNLIKVHVVVLFLWDILNLLLLLYHLFFLLDLLPFFGLRLGVSCFEQGRAFLELGIGVNVTHCLGRISLDLLDSGVFELLSALAPVRSEQHFEDLILGKCRCILLLHATHHFLSSEADIFGELFFGVLKCKAFLFRVGVLDILPL